MLIADVYINIPIKSIAQAFSYLVPQEFCQITAGWRVLVPFGGRDIEGFVVEVQQASENEAGEVRLKGSSAVVSYDHQPIEERCLQKSRLKPIKALVDDEPWFSPLLMEASRWLAEFYLCSAGEMMRLFMPGKSGMKIQLAFEAMPEMKDNMLLMVEPYRHVYEALLAAGISRSKELAQQLTADGHLEAVAQLPKIIEDLLKYKVIRRVYEADHRAKGTYENYLYLPQALTEADVAAIGARKKAQQRLASFLVKQQRDCYSIRELKQEGFSLPVIKALAEAGLAEIKERRVLRDSYGELQATREQVKLTPHQLQAVEAVSRQLAVKETKTFLLYGVTGSGKTQVYIEAARQARELGRRVIVLVPEIALTGQVVQSFKGYFGNDIVVMHSRLSVHERNDAVLRVRKEQAGVIIGARSALFTPAEDVGLIIMDEEQDNSYKQDESPRYHARVVAQKLAELHGAVLLLGSATPSLETYYRAMQGQYGLLRLPQRIGNHPMPVVKCVDMRQELKMGRRSIISLPLKELIETTITKGEQLILMLNRRGFSTFVMCRSCGEVIKCPECTMPLVYHKDGRLLCHHCDIQVPVPDVCPKCQSRYIKYFGSGTEKLEQELQQLVPQARVIRMDRDTTTGKFGHTEILDRFRRREFDILLGTQMVAKGHDIPNVTAVGIISADSTLNMPDFRAAERVFMLITQTAGRAGRGDIPGRVVVQCYAPEHPAVVSGATQDYEAFYQKEMELRKLLFYPPFCRIIKLTFQGETEQEAREAALALKHAFLRHFPADIDQQVAGPAPAMMAWVRGIHRIVLLLKTADLAAVQRFLSGYGIQRDMRVIVDIDPLTTS